MNPNARFFHKVELQSIDFAESSNLGVEIEVVGQELSGENEKEVFNADFFSKIGLIICTDGSYEQRR